MTMKNLAGENNSEASGFIPSSFKFISSCIKTASSGVRSASASLATSISGDVHGHKDQVLWAFFDRLELGPSYVKHVLLLGYTNGFQVLDVEDASNVSELVSKHDDPVSFLQMQPLPAKSEGCKGFRESHPLLVLVACDKSKIPGAMLNGRNGFVRDGSIEPQTENIGSSATTVRFYSLRSHNYVHSLRFRSTVYMVRCSPQIVAVGLAAQIYCFDALTLENKFSVLTYPVPQLGCQVRINIGYGPMAVGPRWLAYASNSPLLSNTGRLSPESVTPPAVSPSTSPSGGNLLARYAMESSKHLAAGLINLSDMGYKTLSKYYQDLVPDGSSSPLSSSSSRKVSQGTSHSTENDTAGLVVIKDIVSRAVVTQFRAHTSQISALCFDPSGTLLVTASIQGNNINIFRIMPSYSRNGSVSQSNDWSCSHVHLYKLHRGMTSAIIQDICFSHYSQWVAIITSKGTCHIFVLAPFGGETVLQIQNPGEEAHVLLPIQSLPWWFTPHFTVNQQHFSTAPPPPVILSVVSRIKNNNAGWFNTVSNVASSATGKVCIPSGAMSAVFHSFIPHVSQNAYSKFHALEHLLVYAPSGHLIQYKLLPSVGANSSEMSPKTAPLPSAQIREEDLRVKVEPVQWWDVCRRDDWPEREEYISQNILSEQEGTEMVLDTSDNEDNCIVDEFPNGQSHFSNVEVLINSGRMPIWQKSEVSFYAMSSLEAKEQNLCEGHTRGEIEIETIPVNEIDIRQKNLLPVFNHFHRIQSSCGDRDVVIGRCPSSSSDSQRTEDKFSENTGVAHPKLKNIPGSAEKSDGGLSAYFSSSIDLYGHEINCKRREEVVLASPLLSQHTANVNNVSAGVSYFTDNVTTEVKLSKTDGASDSISPSLQGYDLNMEFTHVEPIHESPDLGLIFQESYYRASVDCGKPTEVATDVDGSPRGREKSEEDGDNNDLLGGVFDLSEEG